MTTIRRRELERLLAHVGAGVLVTVDQWDGFDHADLARLIAPSLPELRTLVVLGRTESPTEIDFTEFFENTPWEQRHPVALDSAEEDPDAVSIVHSDGRPFPGYELDIRSDAPVTAEQPGRLFVRGPAVCLATVRGEDNELTVISEHDDGWYDTGDLATWDGHGGIRLIGRVADRVGGAFMIPIADVEDLLMQHPAIADIAVVGYLDEHAGELACAVITVRGETTPTLDDLRDYLTENGMTEWYLPTRLERLEELPRNSTGKIRKELLRSWLNGGAGA